jgi:CheY-like chemotaxis protein
LDDGTDLRQTIAHEINNPLAALIANLQLAIASAAEGDLARVIDELRDAAAAAERIREQVQRTLARPASPPPPATAAAPSRRGRVLVVDDEPLISRTIRRVLSAAHDIVIVDSGAEALAAVAAGPPFDVVLCDLMMPGMSGMEVHAALAASHPELASRMVFMTGGAYTAQSQQFLADVANPRLDKPFDAGALRALVASMIS